MQQRTESSVDPSVWLGLEMYTDGTTLARRSPQLERVLARGLLPSIEVAARLLRLLRDPEFQLREVSRVIQCDPALTARVLGLSNSAVFARSRPCRDVAHAVTMLGAGTVGELAAVAAVGEAYGLRGVEGKLRSHAVATAAVARELCVQLGRPTVDVFLAGLLHDLGKIVLLQGAGDESYGTGGMDYQVLLQRRAGQSCGTHLLEQSALGFDHADMGCVALEAWNIPEPIPRVIGWHHSLERVLQEGGRTAELVCLVRVADSLAHVFAGPRYDDRTAGALLREPAAMAGLGLSLDDLLPLIPQLRHANSSSAGMLD